MIKCITPNIYSLVCTSIIQIVISVTYVQFLSLNRLSPKSRVNDKSNNVVLFSLVMMVNSILMDFKYTCRIHIVQNEVFITSLAKLSSLCAVQTV